MSGSHPGRNPIDCGKALGRVWAYLDGELTAFESQEFEAHVAHCSKCGQSRDFEKKLLEAIRAVGSRADPATAALRERVLAALRQHEPAEGD